MIQSINHYITSQTLHERISVFLLATTSLHKHTTPIGHCTNFNFLSLWRQLQLLLLLCRLCFNVVCLSILQKQRMPYSSYRPISGPSSQIFFKTPPLVSIATYLYNSFSKLYDHNILMQCTDSWTTFPVNQTHRL